MFKLLGALVALACMTAPAAADDFVAIELGAGAKLCGPMEIRSGQAVLTLQDEHACMTVQRAPDAPTMTFEPPCGAGNGCFELTPGTTTIPLKGKKAR